MKRKAIEIGKDAVIALLLCSIVLLTRLLLPQSITGGAPRDTALPADATELVTAAKPLWISLRSEAGRATVEGSADALDAAWEKWGSLLGQAMETATAPEGGAAVSEEAFYDAMAHTGVYFGFAGAIPTAALGRWLGSEQTDLTGFSADYLLTAERDGVALWSFGAPCMRLRTELPREALTDALADVMPDGSRFCLELPEEEQSADPLTFWAGGVVTASAATWENPCDDAWANALAASLSFNPYGAGTYTDPQGNTVFTETSRTCTVSASGGVTLQSASEDAAFGMAADDTPTGQIEAARALLETICGASIGDARLYLTGYETGENAVCRFCYVLNGRPVAPDAAAVTFDGSRIVAAEALVRTLRLSAAQQTLMPIKAAAAIAASGSRLTAAYALAGGGAVEAGWAAR